MNRKNLQSACSERETILVQLDLDGHPLKYQPGDHGVIYPVNDPDHVTTVIERLAGAPPRDQLVKLEWLREKQTPLGK